MIHPTAIISDEATIGDDVHIGPYAVVEKNCTIGSGCRIGPHAVIYPYSSIGEECRIHKGAVVGDTPQDLGFKECMSYVEIGDRCVLREGVTIHRGTAEGSKTIIGDDCYMMAFSHAAHNVTLESNVILANGVLLAGYVHVGKGTFMSGNSAVHQFARIGAYCMIGGGAGISKDVPPYVMAATGAYNIISGLNAVGLKRAGFSVAERKEIKEAYRILYRSDLAVSRAVSVLKEKYPEGAAAAFWQFAEKSERGLVKAAHGIRSGIKDESK